jgi:class 3 adenylate cyclase
MQLNRDFKALQAGAGNVNGPRAENGAGTVPHSEQPSYDLPTWQPCEEAFDRRAGVRRLAAILAADVVGYSRLMGRDENGTLARLKAHRTERLEPAMAGGWSS